MIAVGVTRPAKNRRVRALVRYPSPTRNIRQVEFSQLEAGRVVDDPPHTAHSRITGSASAWAALPRRQSNIGSGSSHARHSASVIARPLSLPQPDRSAAGCKPAPTYPQALPRRPCADRPARPPPAPQSSSEKKRQGLGKRSCRPHRVAAPVRFRRERRERANAGGANFLSPNVCLSDGGLRGKYRPRPPQRVWAATHRRSSPRRLAEVPTGHEGDESRGQ